MVQKSQPHETADTLKIEDARKERGETTRCRHCFVGRGWALHYREVREFLAEPGPEMYDGVLCDPPYGLRFMRHHWDAAIPPAEVWSQLLEVCKPGARLLAFGGPKTEHRLACNIEDAGWELRDKVYWVHGEGFPKSLNIGKALERLGEETGDWIGYGTGLRPAVEPVILAMKPRQESFAKNVFKHGCGGLNIDECRIGTSGGTKRSHQAPYPRNEDGSEDRTRWARTGHSVERIAKGRWPANIILDEAAAELLDRQSGRTRSRRSKRRLANSNVGNGRTLGRFRSRLAAVEGYERRGRCLPLLLRRQGVEVGAGRERPPHGQAAGPVRVPRNAHPAARAPDPEAVAGAVLGQRLGDARRSSGGVGSRHRRRVGLALLRCGRAAAVRPAPAQHQVGVTRTKLNNPISKEDQP